MPCPVCKKEAGSADHRGCLVELFKNDVIKSVAEWETMCKKPVTIRKGQIRARIRKEDL